MTALLEVENLRMEYAIRGHEPLIAVDGVSFSVQEGESLAIVGQSGSGKSTCARIIAGLERQTSGTVRFNGVATSKGEGSRAHRMRRASQVQMVFQDPFSSLDPRQSVRDCLDEVLAQHGRRNRGARSTEIDDLLATVGLDDRTGAKKPGRLSGGQRQRVAIARALAIRPRILILDEAVAALDVSVQAQVINLLADLRERDGLTYLFVSHDLGVVRQVSDRCIVMNRGVVVESGTTADVLMHPNEPYTRRLLSAVPRPGWKPTLAEPLSG